MQCLIKCKYSVHLCWIFDLLILVLYFHWNCTVWSVLAWDVACKYTLIVDLFQDFDLFQGITLVVDITFKLHSFYVCQHTHISTAQFACTRKRVQLLRSAWQSSKQWWVFCVFEMAGHFSVKFIVCGGLLDSPELFMGPICIHAFIFGRPGWPVLVK